MTQPLPAYVNMPSSWSVLGGAGMLGGQLVEYLLEAGAESVKAGREWSMEG